MARLLARYWSQTSAQYYVNPEQSIKHFMIYEGKYMSLLEHLERVVDNYRFATQDDAIVTN